jgi:predicted lipid-binding transport protein (Tim44 family)
MKIVLLVVIGLALGLLGGALLGVGAGLVWTAVFRTSDFEGYSGMLVFFTFMPIGAILGGLVGAIGLGIAAGREQSPTGSEQGCSGRPL